MGPAKNPARKKARMDGEGLLFMGDTGETCRVTAHVKSAKDPVAVQFETFFCSGAL